MKYILFLSSSILLLFSCSTVKMDTAEAAQEIIEYTQGKCKDCPTYLMKVLTDGTVQYSGAKGVDKIGDFTRKLTTKEYTKLIRAVRKIKFPTNSKQGLSRGAGVMKALTFMQNGSKQRAIFSDAPKDMKKTLSILESIANSSQGWSRMESDAKPEISKDRHVRARHLFNYQQGACFGKCPNYEVDVFSDLSFIFKGYNFVDRKGIFKGRLTGQQLADIMQLVESQDVQRLDAMYDKDLMDAQRFTFHYMPNHRMEKKSSFIRTPNKTAEALIKLMQEFPTRSMQAYDPNAVDKSKTVMINLKPGVVESRWIASKAHLKLKKIRYVSPNRLYFIASFDQSLEMEAVIEALSKDRDVLAVNRGDQLAAPRGR